MTPPHSSPPASAAAGSLGPSSAASASLPQPAPQRQPRRLQGTTNCFAPEFDADVPTHTLILGTHPSVKSFERSQYYGNPSNAFWWLVGDVLGFRYDAGRNAQGKPAGRDDYFKAVRHRKAPLLQYDGALAELKAHGFALWDVVRECTRTGSLDSSIEKDSEIPNDVRAFVEEHPSIHRICIGGGTSTAKLFVKHNAEWIVDGAFRLAEDECTERLRTKKFSAAFDAGKQTEDDGRIILAVMPSTSPASASASYESKRELWEELCLAPGLADWKAQLKKKKTVGSRAGRPAAVAASGGLAEWVTPSGKIAGGSEAKVTKLGRDLPDESKPKMKLKPKVAEKMPPPPPPPGTTSSGKAKPVRFQDMLDQESSRFDPTHTPGLPFLFGSGALSGSMREDLGDAYLKEGNAYQSGFKGERGFEGAALDLPMGVDSLAPPPPPAPPAPESEEDKKEAEERWVRRMLSADVSFEGVEGTCGLALGVESQTWLEEWQDDFEEWWIATPYHDGLAACFGALSIHLAQRLENAFQTFRGGTPRPNPHLTAPKGAEQAQCEWLGESNALESLQMPDFPDFPAKFELPPMMPIPRLLPDPEHLMSLRPYVHSMPIASESMPAPAAGSAAMAYVSHGLVGAAVGLGAALVTILFKREASGRITMRSAAERRQIGHSKRAVAAVASAK